MSISRRNFLKATSALAGGILLPGEVCEAAGNQRSTTAAAKTVAKSPADYTVRIAATPVEIAPDRIISTIAYNSQFPGPLLRFQEGKRVTVDIVNDTPTPEQLHWHGQTVSPDVDGAAEEGTPFIPAAAQPNGDSVAVDLDGATKRFGDTTALDNVEFVEQHADIGRKTRHEMLPPVRDDHHSGRLRCHD